MAESRFITVKEFGRDEFVEKKSRFIGSCAPVQSEKEAIEFVNKIRSEFPDARHNVYAYITTKDGVCSQRYSDDGEPQGTGGMPVLEVLRRQNITNAAVVVTRYFGGILLGAPGLVRAYGHGASLAVSASKLCHMELCEEMAITVGYSAFGALKRLLEPEKCIIKPPVFDTDITINVIVPVSESERISKEIIDLTSGLCLIESVGKEFYDIE